jgi:hypothetical protein
MSQTITRVQIPAYTDRWMMGDRYGNVVKTGFTRMLKRNRNGKTIKGQWERIEIAHVLLDKSNKVVRVVLADCTLV